MKPLLIDTSNDGLWCDHLQFVSHLKSGLLAGLHMMKGFILNCCGIHCDNFTWKFLDLKTGKVLFSFLQALIQMSNCSSHESDFLSMEAQSGFKVITFDPAGHTTQENDSNSCQDFVALEWGDRQVTIKIDVCNCGFLAMHNSAGQIIDLRTTQIGRASCRER